jgi:hypothetical protein
MRVVNMSDKEMEIIIVWPCTKPILYKIASAVEAFKRIVNIKSSDIDCSKR